MTQLHSVFEASIDNSSFPESSLERSQKPVFSSSTVGYSCFTLTGGNADQCVPVNCYVAPEVPTLEAGKVGHWRFYVKGGVDSVGITTPDRFGEGYKSRAYQQMIQSGNFAECGLIAMHWAPDVANGEGVIDWYLEVHPDGKEITVYSVTNGEIPTNCARLQFKDAAVLRKLVPSVSLNAAQSQARVTVYTPTEIPSTKPYAAQQKVATCPSDAPYWRFEEPWNMATLQVPSPREGIIIHVGNTMRFGVYLRENGRIEKTEPVVGPSTMMIGPPEEDEIRQFFSNPPATWKIENGILFIGNKKLHLQSKGSVVVKADENILC